MGLGLDRGVGWGWCLIAGWGLGRGEGWGLG